MVNKDKKYHTENTGTLSMAPVIALDAHAQCCPHPIPRPIPPPRLPRNQEAQRRREQVLFVY